MPSVTSREPSSSSMRYSQALSRLGPDPSPPPMPKRERKPLIRRIRVEPAKAKPKRDPYTTRWKDLTPQEMASFRLYPKDEKR